MIMRLSFLVSGRLDGTLSWQRARRLDNRDARPAQTADVAGTTVTAAITNEAVDELGLAVGQEAYGVVEASDVMVAID